MPQKCSFLIPVTETGELYVEDNGEVESVVYDTLTVLNTRKSARGKKDPTKTRIVFHMGIHDVGFEQLS